MILLTVIIIHLLFMYNALEHPQTGSFPGYHLRSSSSKADCYRRDVEYMKSILRNQAVLFIIPVYCDAAIKGKGAQDTATGGRASLLN